MRGYLWWCLWVGVVLLLFLFWVAAVPAFWYFIGAQVQQSIEIGFMKNLIIRTETLAQIKMNEIEEIGTDLSQAAHLVSDLVSYPDTHGDDRYFERVSKTNLHSGPELSSRKTTQCVNPSDPDDVEFDIHFTG